MTDKAVERAAALHRAAVERDPTLAAQPYAEMQRSLGFWITQWGDGRCEIVMPVVTRFINREGALHGGVYATLIDAACGYAVCFDRGQPLLRAGATLSLTTSFLKPVRSGVIRAVAHDRGGGAKVRMTTGEVLDEDGETLAIGECTYRLFSGSASASGGGQPWLSNGAA